MIPSNHHFKGYHMFDLHRYSLNLDMSNSEEEIAFFLLSEVVTFCDFFLNCDCCINHLVNFTDKSHSKMID